MAWNSEIARKSLRSYAMDVANDAYDMDGSDQLYSSAGAAFYASSAPTVDCFSRKAFIQFVIKHIGLEKEYAEDWADEIDQGQTS